LKLKHDKLRSNVAFNVKLRPGSLVLVFITGGGLMSAATRFVELLATTFGEQRFAHRHSMVEDVSRKDV